MTTTVMVAKDGEVNLLCLAHVGPHGALFPLPKNGRPERWPHLSDDEMGVLVDQGFQEQGITEGSRHDIDVSSITN
jgi:hypothetical protein